MQKTALISECGTFRYRLGRRWAEGLPLLYVMLNPSTADAEVDDRTIGRCIHFAKAHDFPALEVVNCFAYRTKDPRELRKAGYPVGPHNDHWICTMALASAAVCVAWGTAGAETKRPAEVLGHLRRLGKVPQYLRLTKTGHPEHPLYLPGDLRLKPLTLQAITDAMQGTAGAVAAL